MRLLIIQLDNYFWIDAVDALARVDLSTSTAATTFEFNICELFVNFY